MTVVDYFNESQILKVQCHLGHDLAAHNKDSYYIKYHKQDKSKFLKQKNNKIKRLGLLIRAGPQCHQRHKSPIFSL